MNKEKIENTIDDDSSEDDLENVDHTGEKKETKIKVKNEKRGRVFIRNLPFKSLSEDKLRQIFDKYGEIKEINLPKKENGEFKGFGFVQFSKKREALKAINEMNNNNFEGRKIRVSLAVPKGSYNKNEAQEIDDQQEELKKGKEKRQKNKINRKSSSDSKSEVTTEKKYPPPVNDPARTLFIRNLGFNTTEDALKNYFSSNYGEVLYAKIVKNKETNTSKGTGFVMFKTREDLENVLNIYNKYNDRSNSSSEMTINPFELDGRNLKLFNAVSKEEAKTIEKTQEKGNNVDKRHRYLLYYGLSQISMKEFKLESELTDEDKEKREALIELKKANFKKNPNLHVSSTRLTIRNLDKNIDENKIKDTVRISLDEFIGSLSQEDQKKYNKIKKIKQIKLLRDKNILDRDNNPKSKCVAFIETCDEVIAKGLIKTMSGLKMNKKSKKGLILDFALDDLRKIKNRANKAEKNNTKEEKIEKIKKPKPENNEEKTPKIEISQIEDIHTLVNIYNNTVSRGKKQRILKKLKKLGYNQPLKNEKKPINGNKNNMTVKNTNNFYASTRIENANTNLNKKNMTKNKENKKAMKQHEDQSSTKLLKNKRKRPEKKTRKNDEDDEDEDEDMNPYYQQILTNLNKKK